MDVSGADEALAELKRLGKAGQDATKQVFGAWTREVVAAAKPETPVDPEDGGELRASVRATKPTVTRTGLVSASVVAGGAPLRKSLGGHKANVYAIVQHERLDLKHSQGGPKFIERPFMRKLAQLPARLLEAIDRVAHGR